MPRACIGSAAAAALALASLASPALAAPLAAYGALPTIEQVAISPSGSQLALVVVKDDQRTIVIEDVASHKPVNGVRMGAAKVRYLEWAGDNHVIVTTSAYAKGILGVMVAANEWFVASDFNLAAHKVTPLLGDVDMAGNMIYGQPDVRFENGKPVLYVEGVHLTQEDGGVSLFKIDLDIDHASLVTDAAAGVDDIMVGADGHLLAETFDDALSKKWVLSVMTDGRWRPVQTRSAAIETPDVLGLGRDGHSILLGELQDGHYAVREMAPDGTMGDPLPGASSGDPIHDPSTHQLIGWSVLDGDDLDTHFFDPGDEMAWRAVKAAFVGQGITLESLSADHKRLVLQVDSPTDGLGYALIDLRSGANTWLGEAYAGLRSADIGKKTTVSFKAADGLQLTGYLTLPNGRDPKNLPLIVFPHGGPAARDEPGFDWWAQGMASRGYAVLQVNYRGSDGFGWDFMAAGFGQWGGKMQTDLSDGVRYLAAQGTIDPKRVCIVGASYGGYAALAGATIDLGVYRCAVDVEGPSDLAKLIEWDKARVGGRSAVEYDRYWGRYMAAADSHDPHLARISPADLADKVTIPLMIIHGKDDSVVPFEQSQMMADALHKAGKPFDFVVLNHEDHWLSTGATRLQMLQATMDFVEKHNPPG
ncbi:MAG TPA: S9 family peptidase [Caulobacteraceae bacterium]|jgi:dipeptidyl aminopeptidase/acylaminoacyl peptidase|nr:S9 family peptidase [Caulobacteraceae bacterium]